MSLKVLLFVLFVGAVSAHADLKFDADITPELKAQILNDLGVVQSLNGKGATTLYNDIFGTKSVDGDSLFQFFSKRIQSFGRNDCGGGAAAACVRPNIDSHKMWITDNYIKFNIPQIYRISAIFHESRHTEGEHFNWPHLNCPTPYLDDNGKDIVGIISGVKMEGLPACDGGVKGAYGLQAVLLKNVELNCGNCTEKLRQDGQLFGDDTVYRISNLSNRKMLKKDFQ